MAGLLLMIDQLGHHDLVLRAPTRTVSYGPCSYPRYYRHAFHKIMHDSKYLEIDAENPKTPHSPGAF